MLSEIKELFFADVETFAFWVCVIGMFFWPFMAISAMIFYIAMRNNKNTRKIIEAIKGESRQ